jgi:quercetin dioxygenase-like cupin family protein
MPFVNLDHCESREVIPGYNAVFLHSENLTLAYWTITAGAEMPEHSHEHEQIANLLEGEFELEVDGEKQFLRPGMVALIPSEAPHSGRAVSDCRILDVFHPVREDYRTD